jgi:hypothetical protein
MEDFIDSGNRDICRLRMVSDKEGGYVECERLQRVCRFGVVIREE